MLAKMEKLSALFCLVCAGFPECFDEMIKTSILITMDNYTFLQE